MPPWHVVGMSFPIDLDWRGKNVRLLSPDETAAFAEWAYAEIERLRQERDAYLGRAIRAERRYVTENDCGNDPTPAAFRGHVPRWWED